MKLERLKPIVNDPLLYSLFMELINDQLSEYQGRLAVANDPVDIYRAQGALKLLQSFSSLRDKANAR
jgi:hypothetical protein